MIRRTRLANGLTVLTESMPDVRSVSIGVWLRCGSRNESARLNGISHFIEHLVFKGTEKRTAREIALTMDSIGGQMDAFTSKEYTCFYAKVLDEHLPVAVDLLADIVQRPLFDPAELERERRVVLEEIQMVDDTPDELIYDLFSSRIFPGNALGRPIQGTERTVSGLSRHQLLRFFRSSYRPGNLLVVAAGNVDHTAIRRQVRQAFAGIAPGNGSNGRPSRPRAGQGIVKREKNDLGQLHLLLGCPAFPVDFRERYALYVLNAMLGGTMSSRLFQKIREERGLVYSVYSALNAFADTGFFNVYAATNPKNGDEVVEVVLEELRDLRDRPPGEQELAVAKEHLKGSLMLSLESTPSRMSNLARQEIYYGRQQTLGQTLRGIDQVTAAKVHGVARKLWQRPRMNLAALGRVDRLRLKEADLQW